MNIIGLDKTKVRTSSETAEFTLGTVGRIDGSGRLYKYIKYNSGATPVAAVAGNFQRMVRIADCIGIPFDESRMEMTAGVREELKLNEFQSAENTFKRS